MPAGVIEISESRLAMPQSEPDLAHTLETVAELLPICLTTWESRGKGIRVLRLVSKRVGSVALQAVQSCALQVGIGAQPEPEHVVQLMRDAHLKNLEVTVLITSGKRAVDSASQHTTYKCMILANQII